MGLLGVFDAWCVSKCRDSLRGADDLASLILAFAYIKDIAAQFTGGRDKHLCPFHIVTVFFKPAL
jgi:hypothetical protein